MLFLYLPHSKCKYRLSTGMPQQKKERAPQPEPKPLTFYVSTWGGDASTFGIYDLMELYGGGARNFGLGKVMSAGVLCWQQEQKST